MISVVIPVHNEERSVALLYEELDAAFAGDGRLWEAVFVDDGSLDDSFAILSRLAHEDPRVRLVKLSRNFGSNPALLAGLAHATGDVMGVIAADLQDPPELISEMLGH